MKKLIMVSFILLAGLWVSANAEVTLKDYTYYNREDGISVSFCETDIPNPDEYGIICSETDSDPTLQSEGITRFQGKMISSEGRYAIMLKDKNNILGSSYYIRAYSVSGDKISYSEAVKKVNMKPYRVSLDKLPELFELLEPGDEVYITDGEFENFDLTIPVNGTSYNPIKITSETKGNVVFTGDSNITISGDYVEFSGFVFSECFSKDPIFVLSGSNGSRLSECIFYKSGNSELPTKKLIQIQNVSRNCRVDHNYFEDLYAIGVGIEAGAATDLTTVCSGNRIDNNYFYNIAAVGDRFPGAGNGFECVQLGTEYRDGVDLATIVENNRFENVTGDGSEIISNKSNGNDIRNNTFLNCNSGLTLRTGNNCVVSGNIFLNASKGIIVYGSGHTIKDNYLYKSAGIYLNCGNSIDSSWGDYKRPEDIKLKNNTVIYPNIGGLILGRYFSEDELRTYRPKNIISEGNTFVLNNTDAAIDYIGVNGISYKDNKYITHGSGDLGFADANGFSHLEKSLVFDGDLYIPEGMTVNKDGYMRLSNDIWWRDSVTAVSDKIDKTEPNETPVSFELPQLPQNYFSHGEIVDIRGITGTATYANGEKYQIPSDKVEYTFNQGATASVLNGYKLHMKSSNSSSTYSTQVKYTYKGVSTGYTKFYVAPNLKDNNGEITTEAFKKMSYVSCFNGPSSYWTKRENSFTNNQVNGKDMGIIFTGSYTDYDYVFSTDVTVNKYNNNDIHAKILFGFESIPSTKYYCLQIGKNQGIYGNDGKIGELIYDFVPGTKVNLKIAVKDNMASISVNDKLVGNAVVTISPYGKFGLSVINTYLTCENCSITKNNSVSTETAEFSSAIRAVDSNVTELSFPEGINDEIIRIYKDDEYIAQVRGNEKYYDVNVLTGRNYTYTCEAYNILGAKTGVITKDYIITDDVADGFFRIDNVKVRAGANGEYIDEYYSHRNMFLREGLYPYKDRTYKYTYIPEELRNSGYIKTCNSDRDNAVFKQQTDDWLSFTINRSATVYVAFKSLEGWSLPGWLKGWNKENMKFSISEQPDAINVYSRHFEVEKDTEVTVKLGGFKAISAMYEVIVKPDVMAEEYKLLNFSPTIL